MATTDIVARLQLRAEQFSSETGQRFAELKTHARSAAQDVRSDFVGAFSEVQKIAQTALVLPRTTTGSLDLSREIAQLQASATAAEQKSIASRELSIALAGAASAAGVNAQAMRLEADAAAVASLGEERNAQAIRERILALEAVQVELNQTVSATRVLSAAEEQAVRRSGGNFTMLGQQFQDFTVQIVSGQSAVTAFVQQLPQASYALSTMGGTAGKVGAFLTGPWGTALTIGTLVLTPFVARLFETAKAADLAKEGTSALGSAQSVMGDLFGKASSKIAEQNALLLINARLKAINLRAEAAQEKADSAKVLGQAGQQSILSYATGAFSGDRTGERNGTPGARNASNLRNIVENVQAGRISRETALRLSETQDFTGVKLDRAQFQQAIVDLASADAKTAIAGLIDQSLNDKKLADGLKKPDETKKSPKPKDYSRADDSAEEMIARINSEWDEQPKLVDRARIETLRLDNLIERLQKRKLTPEVEKLIAAANDAKQAIQDGLDRPFRDFVEQQRQSLAIGQLTLEGRDAEAEAMANALRIQQQQGYISDAQLQTVLQLAEQHERISRALEDQRRVIGIYQNAWSGLTDEADRFLAKLQGSTGGVLGVVQKLQRDILSNSLFGGIERDIDTYIRKMTGKQTPAEILSDQARGAGVELHARVADSSSALADFISAVRGASGDLRSIVSAPANDNLPSLKAFDPVEVGGKIDSKSDIVVTGYGAESDKLLRASGVLGVALDGFIGNLHRLGIDVPKSVVDALKRGLPTVLEGMAFGQLGGSIFSKITGGKDDKTGSAIGGVLGEVAGKSLGPAIAKTIGGALGKTIGGAAGPIGAVVGGILGNLVGGLFTKPKWADASLSLNNGQVSGTSGAGRGSAEISAATNTASSVADAVNSIVDQLGATVDALAPLTLGTWNGKYRVALTNTTKALHSNNFGPDILKDFGDDQSAAIQYAVAYELSHAVITGVSEASKRILASGSNMEAALNKVLLIEAIPKDLKAMLDPVGAAVDDLNRKWKRTVDALKEGGASAEQMAQAQQLYDLQLQQVKNSTASASQGLKDFLTSIKLGSNSPYSLRDQEATALAQLKPFLDAINLGQAVDQDKYQAAANAAIDVERQIYGSTKGFFEFLDTIQAATSKAISTIDNAVPITAPVESPFAKATAANTATANEQLQQISEQLAQLNENFGNLSGLTSLSDFIGAARMFKTG